MNKKENKKQDKIMFYAIAASLFVFGFFAGFLFKSFNPSNTLLFTQVRDKGYEYINPLIDFESVESAGNKELYKLEHTLQTYIDGIKGERIDSVSVYYKDLNSGAWIGIEEDEKFSPSSLFKVPVMITFYKIAEEDPSILEQKVVYKKENNIMKQNFSPEKYLEEGKEYTFDEIINQFIIYSDNTLIKTIEEKLPVDKQELIYEELGITNPYNLGEGDTMSVKEYASFFRILYNASYLNKDMSTKALKLLSQTSYTDGIKKGVPEDIKVSHKFGERDFDTDIGTKIYQLHDCGIVYHPTKPYLLCIMTRGNSFSLLEPKISEISKIVYDIVNKN